MGAHYGYIKRSEGADGDAVDVFIGPHKESPIVFVIDQCDQHGRFDEHKALIGFYTEKQAIAAYKSSYTPDWKIGPVTAMTFKQFKAWLDKGSQTKPIEPQVSQYSQTQMLEDGLRYMAENQPRDSHGRWSISVRSDFFDNLPAKILRQKASTWAIDHYRDKTVINRDTQCP